MRLKIRGGFVLVLDMKMLKNSINENDLAKVKELVLCWSAFDRVALEG